MQDGARVKTKEISNEQCDKLTNKLSTPTKFLKNISQFSQLVKIFY